MKTINSGISLKNFEVNIAPQGIIGQTHVGGPVGYNAAATVTNCCVTGGDVLARDHAGGFIGRDYGNMTNCYAIVNITGSGAGIGGLVGLFGANTLTNCYAIGNVKGFAGGNSPHGAGWAYRLFKWVFCTKYE